MKKVILYGGAFNPPTKAHQRIVEACLAYAHAHHAEMWLMPSGPRPDKSISTNPIHRLMMVRAMLADIRGGERVRIEEFELHQSVLTETHITRDYLRAMYPDVHFVWVFGADSILTMKSWGCGQDIWENETMLVTNRPGYEVADLPPHAKLLNVETPKVSSTEVRACMAADLPYKHLVSPSVHKFLETISS